MRVRLVHGLDRRVGQGRVWLSALGLGLCVVLAGAAAGAHAQDRAGDVVARWQALAQRLQQQHASAQQRLQQAQELLRRAQGARAAAQREGAAADIASAESMVERAYRAVQRAARIEAAARADRDAARELLQQLGSGDTVQATRLIDARSLQAGQTVQAPADGALDVLLADGGGWLRLQPGGRMQVLESGEDALFELLGGRLRLWWQRALQQRFRVRTPQAVFGVRGTAYELEYAASGVVALAVSEGTVEVTPVAGGPVRLVAAGEVLRIDAQGQWHGPRMQEQP
jgi:ferric-dicitrate binding protein FerR (iron transport regulator)